MLGTTYIKPPNILRKSKTSSENAILFLLAEEVTVDTDVYGDCSVGK